MDSSPVTKKKDKIRSPLLFLGLFFLFNPYFAALDILPDFIGYLLIFYCFSDMAKCEYRVESARRDMLWLAALSFARLAAFVLSLGSDDSMRLLLTFSFGAAEILLIIRFAGNLFGGTEYLLQRYGGFGALEKIYNAKFLTLFAFIARAALCCIPEAAVLLVQKVLYSELIDVEDIQIYSDIASYKPYAQLLFVLIAFILGVWWLASVCRFFASLRNDASFLENLSRSAISVPAPEAGALDKKLSRSFLLLAFGAALYFDIYFDRIPALPSFLGTLFIFAALNAAMPSAKKSLLCAALPASALQLAYDVCFKLFGMAGAERLADMPVENSAVMAAVSAACAVFSVLFVRRCIETIGKIYFLSGCEKAPLIRLKYAETAYTVYALLCIPAAAVPTLYAWLALPKAAAALTFIILTTVTYWRVCDESVTLGARREGLQEK